MSLIDIIEKEKFECVSCGQNFDVFEENPAWDSPKHCRACLDIKDRRPSIVQGRRVVARFTNVEVLSLPPVRWQHIQHRQRANARWKIDWSAKHWGEIGARFSESGEWEPWRGRIVIWARSPIWPGDIVNVRIMESEHKVRQTKKRFKSNQSDRLREYFVKMAQAAGREAPATFAKRAWHHMSSAIGEEVIERRRYVVLDKAADQSLEAEHYLCSYWGRVDRDLLEVPDEGMFRTSLRGGPKWGEFLIVPEEATDWDGPLGHRIEDEMNSMWDRKMEQQEEKA